MVTVHRNIPYGPDPRHRIDVYQPEGKGDCPLVIYLHGGSWKWGSRSHYRLLGQGLAKHGFVAAIPDYRLFPQVSFPTFNEDAALAFRWIKEHGGQYGAKAEDISLMGHSAGAHIGALLILDPTYLGPEPDTQISRFIGLAGPYSADLSKIDGVAPIFAGESDRDRTRPIKLVAKAQGFPRVLLLHGEKDRTVGPHNSHNMAAALEDRSVQVETKNYARLGHISILLSMVPGLRWRGPVWQDVLTFLGPE